MALSPASSSFPLVNPESSTNLLSASSSSIPANASPIAPETTATTNSHNTASSSTVLTTPPELEQTLALLSSHRTVLGYLLLARSTPHHDNVHTSPIPLKIIRHTGVVFDGEQGRKYASAITRIVDAVRAGLDDVAVEGADPDEARFMRIRTKRHELMISPNDRFLLAVLHDPNS